MSDAEEKPKDPEAITIRVRDQVGIHAKNILLARLFLLVVEMALSMNTS